MDARFYIAVNGPVYSVLLYLITSKNEDNGKWRIFGTFKRNIAATRNDLQNLI